MTGDELRRHRLHEIWTHLHHHPEPSMQEFATADYLAELLASAGIRIARFDSFPGFIADVGEGEPLVGLRADMDALQEEMDGATTLVHSCGHDANMAVVSTVMLELAKKADRLEGAVRAVFQPAEELGNGAELVAQLGVADGLEYLFGVHLRPQNELPAPCMAPSISHGACLFVVGTIIGEDHHGARPHLGANAIDIALEISAGVQRLKVDPQIPSSAKMTMLRAGGENLNIIPGNGTFGMDLRAQTNEAMTVFREGLVRVCGSLEASTGSIIKLDFRDEVPAAVIGIQAEEILAQAITKTLGDGHLRPGVVTSGSDDFHFYTQRTPALQAAMLAVGANVQPGLHHPQMRFEPSALDRAADVLLEACQLALVRSNTPLVPAR